MKAIHRLLEVTEGFAHALEVKGALQLILFCEQQHGVILLDTLTAFLQRADRRGTCPGGPIAAAGIAFADLADL